jgi:hypothetical protein
MAARAYGVTVARSMALHFAQAMGVNRPYFPQNPRFNLMQHIYLPP